MKYSRERIMHDRDLASLNEIETKALDLAVKRNLKRFTQNIMFQLTEIEWDEKCNSLKLQNATLKNGRI